MHEHILVGPQNSKGLFQGQEFQVRIRLRLGVRVIVMLGLG